MNYINHYINKIICGNALEVLKGIPDESVNCCVCSPPYWNLRDYGVEGQLGLEKTFELYIKHLCDIFDEVKRVLRKDGTCWIVIGDTYGGSGNRSGHTLETSNLNRLTIGYGATGGNVKLTRGYEKCLLDIPYRFSIEMTNRGWIKRNTLIWWKLSCMPSSASDRFTVDFEYLFYFTKNNKTIFWTNEKTLECVDERPLGTKGVEGKDWEWRKCSSYQGKGKIIGICPRCKGTGKIKVSLWKGHDYWFEQQFEPMADVTLNDKRAGNDHRGKGWKDYKKEGISGGIEVRQRIFNNLNPNGRNKRCVWITPIQPFPEAHFAVYPEGLIEIPIKAGCPEFVCKKCGKARVKIYQKINSGKRSITKKNQAYKKNAQAVSEKSTLGYETKVHELGYTDCGCDAGFEGGIVLDPFMGAGTTALVALKQRKRFIGIEIKQEYIDMTNKRIKKVQQEFNLG